MVVFFGFTLVEILFFQGIKQFPVVDFCFGHFPVYGIAEQAARENGLG